jgi:DNA-binding PadR family transcriptional regulator
VKNSLGLNEAMILSALQRADELSVANIASRLSEVDIGRNIDDGCIYIALMRMGQRGFVVVSKRIVTSSDGKRRSVQFYQITAEGQNIIKQFHREAHGARQLVGRTPSPAPA